MNWPNIAQYCYWNIGWTLERILDLNKMPIFQYSPGILGQNWHNIGVRIIQAHSQYWTNYGPRIGPILDLNLDQYCIPCYSLHYQYRTNAQPINLPNIGILAICSKSILQNYGANIQPILIKIYIWQHWAKQYPIKEISYRPKNGWISYSNLYPILDQSIANVS